MKGQTGMIAGLIGLLVLILVGVTAVLPTVQNTLTTITTATVINAESHTPGDATFRNYSFLTNNVDQGVLSVENVTNGTMTFHETADCSAASYPTGTISGNYTLTASTGNITVCSYSGTTPVLVNYTYAQDNYVTGANRTVLSNIPLLIGAALFLFAVALILRR